LNPGGGSAGIGGDIRNRCNIAQMVNVLQSLLLTHGPEGERCVRTTTNHTFSLFKPHRAKTAVRVESDDSSPLGLSISASKGAKELVVSWVNPRHHADLQVECMLKGADLSFGTAQILHDAEWNACNRFDTPDRVVPKLLTVRVEGSKILLDLPRLSVATAVLPIR
jgi:alpha-L-arabinofuranosidase